MSKPDDIPQDVWDATMEICGDIPYGQGPAVTICAEQIARAILAAKAEEREACALVAEAETLTGTPPAWADPMQIAVVAGTVTAAAKSIASAIRKRGEA